LWLGVVLCRGAHDTTQRPARTQLREIDIET